MYLHGVDEQLLKLFFLYTHTFQTVPLEGAESMNSLHTFQLKPRRNYLAAVVYHETSQLCIRVIFLGQSRWHEFDYSIFPFLNQFLQSIIIT